MKKPSLLLFTLLFAIPLLAQVVNHKIVGAKEVTWKRISTEDGTLQVPNSGNQQTASLIADIDQDGDQDFFIAERTAAPALTLYRHQDGKWRRYIIEGNLLRIEAGSAAHDIDNDGDLDIVFGGDAQSNEVWWWENPYPDFDPTSPWNRYTIKKSGSNKHHDQLFGDFDGDGRIELVFWNQGADQLIMAEVPQYPKKSVEWPLQVVYKYSRDSEMEPLVGFNGYPAWRSVNEHEGLTSIDIDGDGLLDIVGGGRWFRYRDGQFIENIIDASYTFSRSGVGDFIKGGRPEVILTVGDGLGPMYMYEWRERKSGTGTWAKTLLIEELDNGHTLQVLDYNNDGNPDIFSAEMRFGEGNPDAKARVLFGDGKGQFQEMILVRGFGIHEGRMADLDGDGDLDILGKPYTWNAPLLNIWINEQ